MIYALTITMMTSVTWMYLAASSAARSVRSSSQPQQSSSHFWPRETVSTCACANSHISCVSQQHAEDKLKLHKIHAEAVKVALLLYLACGASLWFYLLPQRGAALATHAVVIVFGIMTMLHIHCVVNRCSLLVSVRDSASPSPIIGFIAVIPYIVLLWMAAQGAFFGTGHFSEFAGIQWPSAFIGFQDSNPMWRSAILVAINTFAPQAMVAVAIGVVLAITRRSMLELLRNDAKQRMYTDYCLAHAGLTKLSVRSRCVKICGTKIRLRHLGWKLRVELVPGVVGGGSQDFSSVSSKLQYLSLIHI